MSPGHAVRLMSRWPAIVLVSTVVPSGQRFDPRETKLVLAVEPTEMPSRSASQASVRLRALRAAGVGRTSVNTIEIRSGLAEGDEAVLSDMSAWDAYDRIRLD